ncbi:hypothetical protein ACLB2K_062590 [Fragaria x ananassa]
MRGGVLFGVKNVRDENCKSVDNSNNTLLKTDYPHAYSIRYLSLPDLFSLLDLLSLIREGFKRRRCSVLCAKRWPSDVNGDAAWIEVAMEDLRKEVAVVDPEPDVGIGDEAVVIVKEWLRRWVEYLKTTVHESKRGRESELGSKKISDAQISMRFIKALVS